MILLALFSFALEPAELFEAKVRPLFVAKCHACHASSRMGGLDLTTKEGAMRGGNSGPSVIAGKPEESLLVQALDHTHARLKMPPGGKLAPEEIAAVRAWVAGGAIWPDKLKPDVPPPAEYRISAQQRAFWAFQPVRKPAAKSIDELWLAGLAAKGLKPNPEADRRTLIRRAYFDLHGLPPTAEQVTAFEQDKSPDAWAKLVDQLLASPRYGERWGRYWLDVARYSDDQLASQFEIPHPSAFRFRDWVISAFNRDMPYDAFVKAQFAGDLYPGREAEWAAGTGFFAMSPEQQDDRVDAATRGFLGLTVACAQCHDHKFDPIPTKDYYGLLGVFLSTKNTEWPLAPREEVSAYQAHQKRLESKRKELLALQHAQAKELAKVFAQDTAKYLRAARGETVDGLDATVVERWKKYWAGSREHPLLKPDSDPEEFQRTVIELIAEKEKVDEQNLIRLGSAPSRDALSDADLVSLPRDKHYLWRDLFHDRRASLYYFKDADLDRFLSAPFLSRVQQLRAEVKSLESSSPQRYPFLQVLGEGDKIADTHVRIRGSAENLGEIAPRQFLRILAKPEMGRFQSGSGRRELGEAIASADNPLTARVMVNRIWQGHFGRGIVSTASNFGYLGERPSNPQLLDYLAARFLEQGWSVKAMHREIMMSRAYRLSSRPSPANDAIDGDNVALWRFPYRRLDVEALRDSMLAVTGELNLRAGGQPYRLGEESNKRRTVYGFVSRRDLDPTLALFDFANPNATSERRVETSTPLQRLYLLNSSFVERRAEELACRVSKQPDDAARIREAYRVLFQREPLREELRLGLEFVKDGHVAWQRYAQVLLVSNEFVYTH